LSHPADSNNPYQPPSGLSWAIEPTRGQYHKVLKDFRTQIVALGALWIILGTLAAGMGLFLMAAVGNEVNNAVGGVFPGGMPALVGLFVVVASSGWRWASVRA
jgi:hypothetical protein